MWVHDATGPKLDGRLAVGCWVGFDEMSSGHRIYWPGKQSVSDFHPAFLNGELNVDEDIYMEPPHHTVKNPNIFVIKLHKLLYGRKQAGKKWYNSLSHSLTDIRFQKSEVDPAVFYAHINNDIIILAMIAPSLLQIFTEPIQGTHW